MSLVHLEPSLRQSSTFADRLERDEEPFRRVQNVRSARRNQLRRRIKFLCALMLLTYCARFVLTVTIWDVSDSSFTVPFSLGVAYCGLVGASRENRDTLSCFYVCCVASICLYGANVMVQTKMIFDVKRGETIQGNSYTPEQVIPVIITAIGLETFLAIVQVVGAMSGRELVRKHLVVNMQGSRPHLFANNAYSLEFIQRQQTTMETANDHAASLTEGLNIKMTIASIPLRKYVKGSQPEDFPIAGNAPPVLRAATPLNVCVDDSGDSCAPASASSNDEDNLCVICQDNVEDGATVKMLPCKHYFHVHCIDAWLERSLHCPMCMQEIPLIRFYEDSSRSSTNRRRSGRVENADADATAADGDNVAETDNSTGSEPRIDHPRLGDSAGAPAQVSIRIPDTEDDSPSSTDQAAGAAEDLSRSNDWHSQQSSSATSSVPPPSPPPPLSPSPSPSPSPSASQPAATTVPTDTRDRDGNQTTTSRVDLSIV